MKLRITIIIRMIILVMVAMLTFFISCQQPVAEEAEEISTAEIILGVNAYSFSDLLSARDPRNQDQVFTLIDLLDWCATQNIKALDPTAYFFPTYPEVPSDEYLKRFKNYADSLAIAISGTGNRNNFASPDSTIRREGIERAKNWIMAASKIGAPVLRVFAGAVPEGYEENWEEPAQWMIDAFRELIPQAEKYGVKIGIQNHGEMLSTAEQCLYVLEKVDSEWAGLIVDTGNFKTEDPYQDIARVVPYAVNRQVKESPAGIGAQEATNYLKLVRLIKEGGYQGYVPVETLLVGGTRYEPFKLVPKMLAQLDSVIQIVYQ